MPMPIFSPPSKESPITMDSGVPSSRAPVAIASPLPFVPFSVSCLTQAPQRFRCLAPRFASSQLATQNTVAPPRKPQIVGCNPPAWKDFSIRSTESTAISTPPPKPMTAAIRRCGSSMKNASAAPMSRPEPASNPHKQACSGAGNIMTESIGQLVWKSGFRSLPYFADPFEEAGASPVSRLCRKPITSERAVLSSM